MGYNPLATGVPPFSRATSKTSTNNTGQQIPKGTPVRITLTGITTIDVSDEDEAQSIAGVALEDIDDTNSGEVIGSGIILEIVTAIAVGEPVFVSKTGTLTNVKPSIGNGGFVAGDWVIRLGVISKNIDNPSNKDLLVNIQIVGEL